MSVSCFNNRWWLNTLFLSIVTLCTTLAFMLYIIYMINRIALHGVYYDLYIYQNTFFFMLIGLCSFGYFILPFLHTISGTLKHKRLLIYAFLLQIVSLILFYLYLSFLTMFLSVIAMSLYNAIFVLLSVNLWKSAPPHLRFFVLSILYGFHGSMVIMAFKASFFILQYHDLDLSFALPLCTVFLAISGFFTWLIRFPKSLKRPIRRVSDHLFINIFHLMKHYKVFLGLMMLVVLIYVFYASLDLNKIKWFVQSFEFLTVGQVILIICINLVILIAFTYFVEKLHVRYAAIGFTLIFTVISAFSFYWLSVHNLAEVLYIRGAYFIYGAVSLISYALSMAAAIDKLFRAFSSNRVFIFSVFYLLSSILIWIFLQLISSWL